MALTQANRRRGVRRDIQRRQRSRSSPAASPSAQPERFQLGEPLRDASEILRIRVQLNVQARFSASRARSPPSLHRLLVVCGSPPDSLRPPRSGSPIAPGDFPSSPILKIPPCRHRLGRSVTKLSAALATRAWKRSWPDIHRVLGLHQRSRRHVEPVTRPSAGAQGAPAPAARPAPPGSRAQPPYGATLPVMLKDSPAEHQA